MRSRSTPLGCAFLISCLLVCGCAPSAGNPTGGQSAPTISLRVTPTQMAGPDTWMKFEWGADQPVEVVDSNFLTPAFTLYRNDTDRGGEAVCYISLQKRDATVAHYTIKLMTADGAEYETTVETPVGVVANAPPHAHMGATVSGVGIESGADAASQAVLFDARKSWDEQDGQTGLQARWDFDGDGVFDTEWMSTLEVSHAFTRAEALRGTLQTAEPTAIPTYKLPVKMELRDTSGLLDTYTIDETISVYN